MSGKGISWKTGRSHQGRFVKKKSGPQTLSIEIIATTYRKKKGGTSFLKKKKRKKKKSRHVPGEEEKTLPFLNKKGEAQWVVLLGKGGEGHFLPMGGGEAWSLVTLGKGLKKRRAAVSG